VSKQSNSVIVNLLIIVFIEVTVDKDINEIIKGIVHSNNEANIYFNVLEVSCRKNGLMNAPSNNIRHFFSPLCLNRQSVRLMQKLRSTFLSSPHNISKFDIQLDVNIAICHTESVGSSASQAKLSSMNGNIESIHKKVCLLEKLIFFHYYHFSDDRRDGWTHEAAPPRAATTVSASEPNAATSCLVEIKQFISCPWCQYCEKDGKECIYFNKKINRWSQKSTLSVLSLLAHLDSCHVHFTYDAVIDEHFNLHITVRRDRRSDLDEQAILDDRFKSFKFKISKSINNNKIRIRNVLCGPPNPKKGGDVTAKTNVHTRQYYHARLGLPLTDYEFENCDSDDDIDMSYEKALSNRSLDEFVDIPSEEKEFMKMWNFHIGNCPPYASQYVSVVCEVFSMNFGNEILNKGLRHNCLIHYLNLVDFNLIRKEDVKKFMAIIDSFESSQDDEAVRGVIV
jgi:hypothetical protein